MPSLVDRVASRHLQRTVLERGVAARYLMAAFIPDKFFKGYEAELKKVYGESLGGRPLEDAPFLIADRVIPLHRRFIKELIELAPSAKKTLEERLEMRVGILEKLHEGYSNARKAVVTPYPLVSVADHIRQHIEIQVNEALAKLLPTLGKALKVGVSIDPSQVDTLVARALKKVTPDVSTAILEDSWSNNRLEVKYGFYRDHIDKSIPRIIKKSKVETNFVAWFTFIRDILEANYSGRGQQYTEFDLNGMHVMVLDETVTRSEQDKYIKYLDAAYHILQKKKLGRAWYGRVIIECEDCGGPNPHTGGGTGGHFNIQKDWIKLFNRPGKYITELMLHELGHRYWYKSMSPGQRHKFETLVRAHEETSPDKNIVPKPNPIDVKRVTRAKEYIEERRKHIYQTLDVFDNDHAIKFFRDAVDDWESTIAGITKRLDDIPERALLLITAFDDETKALWKTMQIQARGEAYEFFSSSNYRKTLESDIDALPDGADHKAAFVKARKKYVEGAKEVVDRLVSAAFAYIDTAVKKHNVVEAEKAQELAAERQKLWDADEREILPVSDYGKSNIDEAFAEVFAYYCLDRRLTADQEASFKAVLLDKDRTASKVAERWLTLAV